MIFPPYRNSNQKTNFGKIYLLGNTKLMGS
jgi:hypothetical protein